MKDWLLAEINKRNKEYERHRKIGSEGHSNLQGVIWEAGAIWALKHVLEYWILQNPSIKITREECIDCNEWPYNCDYDHAS